MEDAFTRLRTRGRRSDAAQNLPQLLESTLRPLVEATLEPSVFRVACFDYPSTRSLELHYPRMHFGLQPSVRSSELGSGSHRIQEPGIIQHCWVVNDGGDLVAVAFHDGHRSLGSRLRQ